MRIFKLKYPVRDGGRGGSPHFFRQHRLEKNAGLTPRPPSLTYSTTNPPIPSGRICEDDRTDSTLSQSGCHLCQSKRRAESCRCPLSTGREAGRNWLVAFHLDCPQLAQRSCLLYPKQ